LHQDFIARDAKMTAQISAPAQKLDTCLVPPVANLRLIFYLEVSVDAVAGVAVIVVVVFLLSFIKAVRKYDSVISRISRGCLQPKVPESSWIIRAVVSRRGALPGNASFRIPKNSSPEMSTCLEHKPARL
jgi:hypothetical protein